MRKLTVVLILIALCVSANAQKKAIDSIDRLIGKAKSDTQRVNLKYAKLRLLSNGNLDTAIAFGEKLIGEAKRIRYTQAEADARINTAVDYSFVGNYEVAIKYLDSAQMLLLPLKDSLRLGKLYGGYGTIYAKQNKFTISHSYYQKSIDFLSSSNRKDRRDQLSTAYQNNAISYQQESDYSNALANYMRALKLSEQTKDEEGEAYLDLNIAITYDAINEYARAEQSYLKSIALAKKLQLKNVLAYAYANIASLYENTAKPDKQYDFAMKAAKLGNEMADKGIEAASLSRAADALARERRFDEALKLNTRALSVAAASGESYNIFQANSGMGFIFKSQGKYSEAIPYYENAFKSVSKSDLYSKEVGTSYASLSECYEKTGNFDKALSAYKMGAKIADSVRGDENIKKSTELRMNYDFEKQQQIVKIEQAKKDADNKRIKHQQYFLIAILGLIVLAVIIIAIIQFRNNKHRQRAYDLLQRQKKETDDQRQRTEDALSELKMTQSQLIQSAKMASLGELTAGIAHEIQNPLNFVNNFSEVSAELIGELNEELSKGDIEEAKAIAGDVKDNLDKIRHHGKRAESIVKGMLEHSRTSAGQKQPTDINKLADEYLRLAYHGLRAKDKSFNAELVTNFDGNLPDVQMVPQDIGRVILNMINNAFYATQQKAKTAGPGYQPTVEISTALQDGSVLVKVKDNGIGIPEHTREKIMQPFFTTKPTGEGTGLGLSLSYDIIVKGHNGKINIESKEGEGSEFIIDLPIV